MSSSNLDLDATAAKLRATTDPDAKKAILAGLPPDFKRQLVAKLKADKTAPTPKNITSASSSAVGKAKAKSNDDQKVRDEPTDSSAAGSKRGRAKDGSERGDPDPKRQKKAKERVSIYGEVLPVGISQDKHNFMYRAHIKQLHGPTRSRLEQALSDHERFQKAVEEGNELSVQSELEMEKAKEEKEFKDQIRDRATKELKVQAQASAARAASAAVVESGGATPKLARAMSLQSHPGSDSPNQRRRKKRGGGKTAAAKQHKYRKNHAARTVFVTNIPFELSDARLSMFFGKQAGRVVNVNMPTNADTGTIKGYAHVITQKISSN